MARERYLSISLKTVRNLIVLLLSNTMPSIVALAALPILARLFSPEAVGQWAIFQSLLFIAGLLATFRYELAVVVERKDRDADAVLALVLIIALTSCLVIASIVVFLEVLGALPIAGFGLLSLSCLALSCGLLGAISAGSTLCVRKAAFGVLLTSRLLQAVVGVVLPITLSDWSRSGDVLILGSAAGMMAGAICFGPKLYASVVNFRREAAFCSQLFAALKGNQAFAHFGVAYTLVTQSFGLAVTTLLAVTHGTMVVGQFNLMNRAVGTPAGILMASFGQLTARPLTQYLDDRESARKPIFDLVLVLLAISLPLATLGAVYGEEMFVYVFGPTWSLAGRFAEWAAIPMSLLLSVGWIDRLFDAWREQRLGFLVGTLGCAAWLLPFVIAESIYRTPFAALVGWSLGVGLNAAVWAGALVRLVGPPSSFFPFFWVTIVAIVPVVAAREVAATSAKTYMAGVIMTGAVLITYGALLVLIRRHRPDMRPWRATEAA